MSVCLSVCLAIWLYVSLFCCLSVYLSVCRSVCLAIWLSVSLSVYLSGCLSLCLAIWLACLFALSPPPPPPPPVAPSFPLFPHSSCPSFLPSVKEYTRVLSNIGRAVGDLPQTGLSSGSNFSRAALVTRQSEHDALISLCSALLSSLS